MAALFQDISNELKHLLLDSGKRRAFHADEEVFAEGDNAAALPIVLSGKVKMMRYLEPGKEVIIGIFGEGEMFALPPVVDGKSYPASAITMASTELLLIPREKFMELLSSNGELALAVIKWMCDMLREKTAIIQNLASSSPEFRIASILLRISEQTPGERPVLIKLRRSDIAKMAGLTTETTIRTVKKLASRELISIDHGKIIIKSPGPLKKFLNG